jgi:hypothetical protein
MDNPFACFQYAYKIRSSINGDFYAHRLEIFPFAPLFKKEALLEKLGKHN